MTPDLRSPLAIMQANGHFDTSFLMCFGPVARLCDPIVFGMIVQGREGEFDLLWTIWIGNMLLDLPAVVPLPSRHTVLDGRIEATSKGATTVARRQRDCEPTFHTR